MAEDTDAQKKVSARRRLLQATIVGGTSLAVLPEKWTRPVTRLIVTPAHAQTTGPAPTTPEPDPTTTNTP